MTVTKKTLSTQIQPEDHSNQPIGIFDSGLGGLSIFKCIKEQLPNEQLIYIADSLYAPYGDKSDDEIIKRVNVIADRLIKKGCKAIVIACNTATVIAIDQLRLRVSIPIIGVEPAIKPAVALSKNIAILTTQATAKNKRFLALVDKHKSDSNVHIQPCPGLVELIEKNQLHSIKFEHLLKSYLVEVLNKNTDTIVLGCTHYPFFTDKIQHLVDNQITIMETALPVTEQLKRQLIQHQLIANAPCFSNKQLQYQFFSSQANSELISIISTLLNTPVKLSPF